ncbi:MAG: DUF1206 domain-containing protein [Nocardioides sp.]
MTDMSSKAQRAGSQADNSEWFDKAIRAGLIAYGVVHLLIAWLALQLAFGESEGAASSKGAMQQLAEQPFGTTLLWLVAIGMLMLVIWKLLDAWKGHEDEDDDKSKYAKKGFDVLKAVLYGTIGVSALRTAMGGGSSSKGGTDSTTAKIMDLPGGQFLVGLIGLAIIGYGANQVRTAYTEKFREKITAQGKAGDAGQAYIYFGKAGYTAKGIAVGIVGGLFLYAAVTHEAKKSGGLDQALHTVLEQPFGPFLLGIIAVGIACYGLFCFARARYLTR